MKYRGIFGRMAVLAGALLIALMLVVPQAHAADASSVASSIPQSANVDSWSAVASSIQTDLNAGVASLNAGDSTTAATSFQRAYNVDYVASNMAVVLPAETAQPLHDELLALTTDVFVASKASSIPERVTALEPKLAAAAQALDADSSLANPRDYATARAQKTAEERQKLDAAKTRTNAGRGTRTWSDIAVEMTGILDRAQTAATTGKNDREGSDLVNHAYYQYYEKLGFEKTVMSAISGDRVSQVENQFKETRKSMIGGKSDADVEKNVAELKQMLVTDAKILDDGAASKVNPVVSFVTSSFGQAFIILLREGLEAMLVVAAIVAYLAKEGLKRMLKFIYLGVVAGLVASGVMAALLIFLFQNAGSHQEVFEGATALVAMVMLLFTSNWMLGKSSHQSWTRYVDDKTKESASKGSVFSLALLAFLAVFREGAETVIFYQAIMGMTYDQNYMPLVWGALAAVVVLVGFFLVFRYTTVKIPYKPFFATMSVLMGILVVVFAGSGLHELIEADVISGTYMSTWPTNDFLGIYPYVQTVGFQLVMLLVVLGLFAWAGVRARASKKA